MTQFRILSIVWYKVLPAKFGGQKGIANFNKHLAAHYPLVCLCSKDNEPDNSLPYKVLPVLPVSKGQFLGRSSHQKILAIAKTEKPSHIILEHPYHGFAAKKASNAAGAKLIVHSHNIESERYRLLGKWWWRILYIYEKWIHRQADLNLFKTANDLAYAVSHFGLESNKCLIVPYGIDKEEEMDRTAARKVISERHAIHPGEKIVLFAGTLDYEPNAKAVENIYKEIAPRLSSANFAFKIIICGRNKMAAFGYLNKLTNPAVLTVGEVDDMDNYFLAADVFIDPVKEGGGIQTKIIDALNHDCNVVAFEKITERIVNSDDTDKIFTVATGDWQHFGEQAIKASQYTGKTSAVFLNYYDQERIAGMVSDRLEGK